MNKVVSSLIKSSEIQSLIHKWVVCGAVSGAFISGFYKVHKICDEPSPEYVNELLELPMRGVYHTSRIAVHGGIGAMIGGFTALTAPVSIPMYIYWKNNQLSNQKPFTQK